MQVIQNPNSSLSPSGDINTVVLIQNFILGLETIFHEVIILLSAAQWWHIFIKLTFMCNVVYLWEFMQILCCIK